MQDEIAKKKEELEKEAKAAVVGAKKTFMAWLEERISKVHTVWLVLGLVVWSALAWGQDSLPAVMSWLPFGSQVMNWLTDSSMINFDEAFLGIPWFMMLAELGRRAWNVEWATHARAITAHIRPLPAHALLLSQRLYRRLRKLPEPIETRDTVDPTSHSGE